MVIIVFGLPGSGKSYFAARLANRLKARYVNSDQLRLQLLKERTYSDAEKLLVYDAMMDAMTDAIVKKETIVLDATFYKEAIRKRFEWKAATLQETIRYIEITAPEEIIAVRLAKPRNFSEADLAVYQKLKLAFEPMDQKHLVMVSSNEDIEPSIQQAIEYLNKPT
ncbi:MAG: AAA family ATPase [Ferruginibacter sp.]